MKMVSDFGNPRTVELSRSSADVRRQAPLDGGYCGFCCIGGMSLRFRLFGPLMTVAIVRDPIYRGRRFQSEVIELCVRWYLTYRLSYRDLVEMLAERGVTVSDTTIYRSVQQYVPE